MLVVVLVTLVINVLKIFDLVYVISPSESLPNATVVAVQMYQVAFGGTQDTGLGSALGVLLFLLVIPAMIFNIRRLRRERRHDRHRRAARGHPSSAGKAARTAAARLAARLGTGVIRLVVLLVGLFWLLPTFGLLRRQPAQRRPTTARPAGGRCSRTRAS